MTDSTSASTGGDSFADQRRNALEAAAKSAGYGSLERLMSSVRVRGRSTPSRAEHVLSLVQAGLLKEDAEISQMASGAVPDAAWDVFSEVHPDRSRGQRIPKPPARPPSQRARARVMDSWSLSVHSGNGVTAIDVDPARAPEHELPVALIAKSLETLSLRQAGRWFTFPRTAPSMRALQPATWSASGSCCAADFSAAERRARRPVAAGRACEASSASESGGRRRPSRVPVQAAARVARRPAAGSRRQRR